MTWKNAFLALVSILIFGFWIYIPLAEYEDPDDRYSVTISYDCRLIDDDDEVPKEVVEECNNVMKKEAYGLKTSKSSI